MISNGVIEIDFHARFVCLSQDGAGHVSLTVAQADQLLYNLRQTLGYVEIEKPERVRRSDDLLDPLAVLVGQRRFELTPTQYKMFWHVYTEYKAKGLTYFAYPEIGQVIYGKSNKPSETIKSTGKTLRATGIFDEMRYDFQLEKHGLVFTAFSD